LARTALAALDFSGAEASAARAVELDETPARLVLLTEARAARKVFEAAAAARSQPAPPSEGGRHLGVILIVLAVAGVFGWIWGVATKSADEETSEDAVPPQSLLPGDGRLEPREALQALEAAAVAEPDPRALAESLYQRAIAHAAATIWRLGRTRTFRRGSTRSSRARWLPSRRSALKPRWNSSARLEASSIRPSCRAWVLWRKANATNADEFGA
jgi:hypothetical protein